jgi:hypothetical protein
VQNNAILIAILAYKASEEAELMPREKRIMPLNADGERESWPQAKQPQRSKP